MLAHYDSPLGKADVSRRSLLPTSWEFQVNFAKVMPERRDPGFALCLVPAIGYEAPILEPVEFLWQSSPFRSKGPQNRLNTNALSTG